jgi:hypothetical protein
MHEAVLEIALAEVGYREPARTRDVFQIPFIAVGALPQGPVQGRTVT